MYQTELARSGTTLFKIRGTYIYLIIVIGVAICYLTGAQGPFNETMANKAWFWVALTVATAGALWRFIVNGFAALGTSGNQKKSAVASELNTTGPYSLVRNPLYVGRIVNFTGIAMLSGSWEYTVITFLLSFIVYERISVYEEEFLRDKFGEAHSAWAAEVPALWPRFHGWTKPKYPFWWRRAIRREYKKFFQLATAVVLYDLARRGFTFPEDLTLYYVYAAFVVWRLGVGLARAFGAFKEIS